MAIGADGCRAGWVAACLYEGGSTRVRVFGDIGELAEWREGCSDDPPVAIDMPMGLPPEPGLRPCDRQARELLGARRSCVFQPPPRWMFGASGFAEVQSRVRERGARGLSRQAFGILPKVCELDRFLCWEPAAQDWLFEAHPEVSFARIGGGPIRAPKKSDEGRRERLRLLRREFPDLDASTRSDDVLDAYAVLWTARRLANGEATALGSCERDAAGLVMRIVA